MRTRSAGRVALLAGLFLLLASGCGGSAPEGLGADAGGAQLMPDSVASPSATAAPVAIVVPTLERTNTPQPTASPSPTAAPPLSLVGSYPIDGDGAVQPQRPLVLAFDRALDLPSLQASLVISPTVTGRFEWQEPHRVAFYPDGGWDGHEAWQVSLDPGAYAADGGSLAQAWSVSFSTGGRGTPLPVLMYHHVEELGPDATEGKKDWTVSPQAFQQQMAYLQEAGWHSISSAALAGYLLDGEPLSPRPVMISVDDGNRSFYENGWPIIQATGLRPVMFLVAQFADYSGYVSWDEARALVAGGAWIGSHGYSHRSMHEVPLEELAWELSDSRAVLESELGVAIDAFCFPYGGRTDASLAALPGYGYRTGYSLNPTYWQRPEDPFFIGRLRVDYRTTMEEFAEMLPD
ncbi:MAG: polysaccharide deacetylase family protein [Chloroflexi bacterium]|nr:polysaccharide deacetylase family protein [Chloroflexota bacterium]